MTTKKQFQNKKDEDKQKKVDKKNAQMRAKPLPIGDFMEYINKFVNPTFIKLNNRVTSLELCVTALLDLLTEQKQISPVEVQRRVNYLNSQNKKDSNVIIKP